MENIFSLHHDLAYGSYKQQPYQAFTISDPKVRSIHKPSVRDRLLHHAIYRKLYPFFDESFIYDSCSCRINKGTHKGFERVVEMVRKVGKNYTKPCFALKMDIRKFFDSIDHQILFNLLTERIEDKKILWLLAQIIKGFEKTPSKGMSLGNLTSQLFANIYMNPLDQFVKHKLKAKNYLRYADDFMIVADSESGYAAKDPETFEIVRQAWLLMASGTKTLQEMADYLNKKGLKSGHGGRKGYEFRPQTVSRLFHNKFYAGKIVSPKWGEEVLGQHSPMITEAQFYRVQEILDGRSGNSGKLVLGRWSRDNEEFVLRRIVKCSYCGRSYTGAKSKGRTELYSYYFCPNRCKCSYKVSFLDGYTAEYLGSITPTKETIDLFNAYLRRTYYSRIADLKKRQDQAGEELTKLYELRQGLVEKHLMGIYSDEMFKEQNAIIEQKIKAIHIANNDGILTQYSIEKITQFVEKRIGNLQLTFSDKKATLQEKRTLLGSIFPSGLHWDGKQYSNQEIDGSYKFIQGFSKVQNGNGSANGSRTRDLLDENQVSWTTRRWRRSEGVMNKVYTLFITTERGVHIAKQYEPKRSCFITTERGVHIAVSHIHPFALPTLSKFLYPVEIRPLSKSPLY